MNLGLGEVSVCVFIAHGCIYGLYWTVGWAAFQMRPKYLTGLNKYRAQPKWPDFGRNSFFRAEIQNLGGRWLDVRLPLVQLGSRGRDRRQEEQQ